MPVTTILNFKQMNIPAAKQKVALLNSQFSALSADEMAGMDKAYAFLTLPAAKLPAGNAKVRSEGEDYNTEVVMKALKAFGYEERFPGASKTYFSIIISITHKKLAAWSCLTLGLLD